MKKIIFFISVLVTSFSAQAQKEAYNWYFGNNVGITFNTLRTATDNRGLTVTGVPTSILSPIKTDEGCFAISNATTGAVIAASDGMKVYDSQLNMIDSGLNGNTSSAQSGIVIPWPGKPNFYFAVSNKQSNANTGGIFYSVYEDKGTTGVITNKNTPLNTGSSGVPTINLYENCMAVHHANGTDYWLLNRTGNYMFAWLITKDGFVSPTPTTITKITGTQSVVGGYSEGYMKVSPDGKTVCHASIDAPNGEIMMADFDNATGSISNVRFKYFVPGSNDAFGKIYGLEFSPKGKNLYLAKLQNGLYVIPVAQFMTAVPNYITGEMAGAQQLGPDGRLYSTRCDTKTLGMIENPDDDFVNLKVHIFDNYFYNGGYTATGKWGLPTFPASMFDLTPAAKKFACTGNPYKFSISVATSGADVPIKLAVDYGDGTSDVINLVTGQSDYNFGHSYALPNVYTVTITPQKAGGISLSPTTVTATAVDCLLKTNRMIRVDLKNLNTLGQ